VTDQLNYDHKAAALEWKLHLSHHRAISYSRRTPTKSGPAGVSVSVLRHADFPRRVKLAYYERLLDRPTDSAIERLVYFQNAMKAVSAQGNWSPAGYAAVDTAAERVGICLKYIRAVERKSTTAISVCLLLYPGLRAYVANVYNIEGNTYSKLQRMREHIQDLVRQQSLEELAEAEEIERNGNSDLARRMRQKAARLLYKLAPGRAGAVGAIRAGSGAVVTDTRSMASLLRGHWAEVFRAQGVDEELLGAWIHADVEERRAEGSLHLVLRDIELRRRHVAQAVARSNNSAPGPDGIPYAAWRRMGNVGIDVLFAAACEIASEDGSHLLAQHYGEFNASVLMFLPQKAVGVLENGQEVFEVGGVRPSILRTLRTA